MAEYLPDFSGIWPEWRAVEKVGEGSFGRVYRCERNEYGINAVCAIKIISIPKNESEINAIRAENSSEQAVRMHFRGIVEDFANEIKMMVVLKGAPNIVSVENYKIVERTDGIGWDIYIRMEYLTAFTKFARENSFTERAVSRLAADLCNALEICAEKNIVHRDIKPDNIFIDGYGNYKIGDFGVARRLENATSAMSKKGTYTYMAPEVYKGDKHDNRADIYSLGMVMYKLLNRGRDPFTNPYAEAVSYHERQSALERRMHGESLPAPVEATPEMSRIILKACAYDPGQRYITPGEMKRALKSIADGFASDAAPALNPEVSASRSNSSLPLFMEDGLINSLSERSKQSLGNSVQPAKMPGVFMHDLPIEHAENPEISAPEPTKIAFGIREEAQVEESTQMVAEEPTAFEEYDEPTAFAQDDEPTAFAESDEPTGFAYDEPTDIINDEATAFAESYEDTVIANNKPPKITKADYGIVEADEDSEESGEEFGAHSVSSEDESSQEEKKGVNILGIVAVIIILAVIGLIAYFSTRPQSTPSSGDSGAVNNNGGYNEEYNGDYNEDYYDSGTEYYDTQVDIDAINTIKTDFANDSISYSYACEQLSSYINSNYYDVSSAASSAQSEIDAINTNREYYNSGVSNLANGYYSDAIDDFNSISSDYPQYSDVESKISEAKQAYKNHALSWVDYYINSNEFDSARNELDNLSAYVNDSDVAAAYDRIEEAEDEYYLEYYWNNEEVFVVEDSEMVYYNDYFGENRLYLDICNSTNKTVVKTVMSVLEFDSNGNPVTCTEYVGTYENQYRINTANTINAQTTYDSYDADYSWGYVSDDVYYTIACVDYAEFSDGTTWYNPYHDYWLEAYHDSYWDYANRNY